MTPGRLHNYVTLLLTEPRSYSAVNNVSGNRCESDCISRGRKFDPEGAQWLSGRVLDSRPKGSGFEPHRRHCVVVLEQDTFILA